MRAKTDGGGIMNEKRLWSDTQSLIYFFYVFHKNKKIKETINYKIRKMNWHLGRICPRETTMTKQGSGEGIESKG